MIYIGIVFFSCSIFCLRPLHPSTLCQTSKSKKYTMARLFLYVKPLYHMLLYFAIYYLHRHGIRAFTYSRLNHTPVPPATFSLCPQSSCFLFYKKKKYSHLQNPNPPIPLFLHTTILVYLLPPRLIQAIIYNQRPRLAKTGKQIPKCILRGRGKRRIDK